MTWRHLYLARLLGHGPAAHLAGPTAGAGKLFPVAGYAALFVGLALALAVLHRLTRLLALPAAAAVWTAAGALLVLLLQPFFCCDEESFGFQLLGVAVCAALLALLLRLRSS